MSLQDSSSGYGSNECKFPKLRLFMPDDEDWEDFEFMINTTLLPIDNITSTMKFLAILEAIPKPDRRLLAHIDRSSPNLRDVMDTLRRIYGKTLDDVREEIKMLPDYRNRTHRQIGSDNIVSVEDTTIEDWKEIMKVANVCANYFRSADHDINIEQTTFNKLVEKLPVPFTIELFSGKFGFERLASMALAQMTNKRKKFNEQSYNNNIENSDTLATKQRTMTYNGLVTFKTNVQNKDNKKRRQFVNQVYKINDYNNPNSQCPVCKKRGHKIWMCRRGASAIRRCALKNRICYACLNAPFSFSHRYTCKAKCGTCSGAHHTSLHPD